MSADFKRELGLVAIGPNEAAPATPVRREGADSADVSHPGLTLSKYRLSLRTNSERER